MEGKINFTNAQKNIFEQAIGQKKLKVRFLKIQRKPKMNMQYVSLLITETADISEKLTVYKKGEYLQGK